MKLSLIDETTHLQNAMAGDKASPTKQKLGLEDCRVSSRIFLRADRSLGHQEAHAEGLCYSQEEWAPALVVTYN